MNLPRIGTTAIYNAIQHTKHLISSTTGIQQTDKNNIHHCQARYNWFRQLYARMGETTTVPLEEETEFTQRFDEQLATKKNNKMAIPPLSVP